MEIYGPDKIHIQQSRLTYNTLYLVRHRLVFASNLHVLQNFYSFIYSENSPIIHL